MNSLLSELHLPQAAATAVQAGQLWRAKEVLQGRVGGSSFDPKLYEQYGAVLLAMGDQIQAGKYLFASGAQRQEYEEPIRLFLSRHGQKGWKALVSAFPARAKVLRPQQLPSPVRECLLSLGMPESSEAALAKVFRPWHHRVREATLALGCVLLLGFAAASLLTGAPIVLRWIGHLLK